LIKTFFKKEGIQYNPKTKIVKIELQRLMDNPFVFYGADDKVGANYTRQNVVRSVYEMSKHQS
jgi:hypothetical protein